RACHRENNPPSRRFQALKPRHSRPHYSRCPRYYVQRCGSGQPFGRHSEKASMRISLVLFSALSLYAQEAFPGAAAADEQINQAVKDGTIPGAVLLIGHDGKIAYRKAYGERALIPKPEPMT